MRFATTTLLAASLTGLALGACKADGDRTLPKALTLDPAAPSVAEAPTTAKDGKLAGLRVAILATDGFEQAELVKPRKAYADEGAMTTIVSPKSGRIQGYNHDEKGELVNVDINLDTANPNDFDALELPGGVVNGDALRLSPKAIEFVRAFTTANKPVAAICHGFWTLIDADAVRGKTLTSWPSLKNDLKNAGATWVDQPVVVDGNFVSSRKPDDIPAFNEKAIGLFAAQKRGVHRPG
jgi:protease I